MHAVLTQLLHQKIQAYVDEEVSCNWTLVHLVSNAQAFPVLWIDTLDVFSNIINWFTYYIFGHFGCKVITA